MSIIDKELKDMLSNNSIDYKEYIVNDDTVDDIFNYINTIEYTDIHIILIYTLQLYLITYNIVGK